MKYNQPKTKVLLKSPELMQSLPVVNSNGTEQLGNEVEFNDDQDDVLGSTKSVWEE